MPLCKRTPAVATGLHDPLKQAFSSPVSQMTESEGCLVSGARNMVRALREGGFFAAKPPASPARRVVTTVLIGLVFGALAYLFGVFVVPQLPNLLKLGQKTPPPAHYMKPAG